MLERMRRTWFRSSLGPLLLAGLVACGDGSLEPLPFEVSIQASPTTTTPGSAVNFVVTAQGGSLLGLAVDYGDTSTDVYGAGGARTARFAFSHAYSAAGTYEVRARVTDALAGDKDATVEVRVQ
jgi:hypothetical protein